MKAARPPAHSTRTAPPRMSRRSGAPGFTLVEMLVALFIFGLVSAAGVAVMAYAADNQGVVREHMAAMAEFQRARALLRADLGQAATRRTRDLGGQPARRAFVGGQAGAPVLLGLVRRGWSNPDGEPRASLQYVEYRLVDAKLERSTRPALDGSRTDSPQVLLDGVRSATLRYRYRGEWLSGWPGGGDALPEAIALRLDIAGLGQIEQLFMLPAGGA